MKTVCISTQIKRFFFLGIFIVLFFGSNAFAVNTHIQTDSTLSGIAELNINTTGSGQLYTLSEINGKLAGNNLFYSFSNFSIGTGDSAWFSLNTPGLENVISRVTGGTESVIDGQLKMTNASSAASFFFINPAGITFSSGASVDVPGSFYVSTASGLNFGNGDQFPAIAASSSFLSSASPESFGFLGNEAGIINIGSSETAATFLTFKPGTNIAFAANNIAIENGVIANKAFLNDDSSAPGINLQISAIGNKNTVINPSTFADQLLDGKLTIQKSFLILSGNGSGYLGIQSGNLTGIDSIIKTFNTGDQPMTEAHRTDIFVKSDLIIDNTLIANEALANGDTGLINVTANSIELLNEGAIISRTSASGNAGFISVQAEYLKIDGSGNTKGITGISSLTADSSSGHAGNIFVDANTLEILNAGKIASGTDGTGNSGFVTVKAKHLTIDGAGSIATGIGSVAESGNTNVLFVDANTIEVLNGGSIISMTLGNGISGPVIVKAEHLIIDGNGQQFFTGITSTTVSGNPGFVYVGSKEIEILNAGVISSSTEGTGDAGIVSIQTELLKIDGTGYPSGLTGIVSNAQGGANSGDAGSVSINADSIELFSGGTISSSSFSGGNAGFVGIKTKYLTIEGTQNTPFTGIETKTKDGIRNDEVSGRIFVEADSIKLMSGGTIGSSTFGSAKAGFIFIQAKHLKIDGTGNPSNFTGISSNAQGGIGSGDALGARIKADSVELLNGGKISSSTFGHGDAGVIQIESKILTIDGAENSSSVVTGIQTNAALDLQGNQLTASGSAGMVIIETEILNLHGGSVVSLTNNSNPEEFLNGIIISADQINLRNNSLISVTTYGQGDAGVIGIQARNITIENNSSIDSISLKDSTGVAGSILIVGKESDILNEAFTNVDSIKLESGGTISTSSLGSGTAGNIKIYFQKLSLDSEAKIESNSRNGQGGNISLNGGKFTYLNNSIISTSAENGNGGDITIQGDGVVFLLDSAITTSVSGESGDGGDIAISTNGLILNSGFVQANTAASGASGGNVNIKTPALIPSGNLLLVGGNNPFQFQPSSGLNVIQAAAPDGVSGTINTTTPQLNLNAMLTNLTIESFDTNALNRDMCSVGEGSSLLQSGRGAQPLRARDLLLSPVF